MRAVWFVGGLAFRSFRAAPLLALVVVAVVLWVAMGVSEPYDSPVCDEHPTYEACR